MRNRELTNQDAGQKKGFDKKKWRERHYSHKFKVQQFDDRRKKKVLRKYYRELKYIQGEPQDPKASTSDFNHPSQRQPTQQKKMSATQKANLEFERIKQQKLDRKADLERKKAEKEQKLKEYREKKAERFKRLSKKTKKGQPVMKDRLEMLLEKIQKQCR
ncbi:Hypothetical predicted protein [Cloeon dipterum]|uniref:rRNA-processing protein FYV7 n=1 Tax=Cloeon dipterum TaxID=197152 RepID=A0A8S1BVC3_9INSE|nr:Hypothetical predicted protein [Cloeon dipterum]